MPAAHQPGSARRTLRQGFLVGVTNAKTAVFFAAVLPQFVDPHRAGSSSSVAPAG
jgi:threonine/homoserine/homoserine lactone efflux protein